MKHLSLIVLAALVGQSAMAKVSIFSNEQAVAHTLSSSELLKVRHADRDLQNSELAQVSVKRDAERGIGDVHTVTLQYTAKGASLLVCNVDVKVETVKTGRGRITASKLGTPNVGRPACAH